MVKVRVKKFGAAKVEVPEHPDSRKVKQRARKDIRKVKIAREHADRRRQRQPLLKKCLFFQRQVLAHPNKATFDLNEISTFIRQYIGRFDVELQEIAESKRSKYRQVSNTSRELDLKSLIRSEINNFATGGYEAPDLTNPEIVTALREWSGASNFVGQFKLASFKDTLGGEITSMPGYVENDNDNDDGDDNDNDNDNDDGGDDDDNAD